MGLEETEARDDSAGEGQQQFNLPIDGQRETGKSESEIVVTAIVRSRCVATPSEDVEDLARGIVNCKVHKLVKCLQLLVVTRCKSPIISNHQSKPRV
jgi:hypothetical protein